VSKKALIIRGEFEIEWDAFGTAVVWFSRKGYLTGSRAESLTAIRNVDFLMLQQGLFKRDQERVQHGLERDTQLLDMLRKTTRYETSQPRDKIFALLGLVREGEDQNPPALISPDYGKPQNELYLDITLKLLDKYRTLAPLSFVEHKSLDQEEIVPTWVPRWHIAPAGFVGANRSPPLYGASAQAERHMHWTANDTTLTIRGLRVSTIAWCGEMMTFPIDEPYEEMACRAAWKRLNSRADRSESPTNHSPIDVFIRTSTAGVADLEGTKLAEADQTYDFQSRMHFGRILPTVLPSRFSDRLKSTLIRDQTRWDFAALVRSACKNRRYVLSEDGHFCLAPGCAREGDLVVVLFGGELPFLLRPANVNGAFYMVGGAYIHGLMHGEAVTAWEKKKLNDQVFTIH